MNMELEEHIKLIYEKGKVVTDKTKERIEKNKENKMFKEVMKEKLLQPSVFGEDVTNLEHLAMAVIAKGIKDGDVKVYTELAKLNGDYNDKVDVNINQFDEFIRTLNGNKEGN